MRKSLSVIVLAAALAACGPGEPQVRLTFEPGRELVYEVTQRDEWPGAEPMANEVSARVRMRCVEHAPGGKGVHAVTLEALRLVSPPRMGIVIDTDTAEAEAGDRHGTEELVRSVLGIESRLVLDRAGFPGEFEPVEAIADPIRAWVAESPAKRTTLALIVAKLVDGSTLLGTSFQPAGLCLPKRAGAPGGSTWTATAQGLTYFEGTELGPLEVTLERPAPDRAVVSGEAVFVQQQSEVLSADQPLVGGKVSVRAEIDTVRGVYVSIDLHNEMTLRDPSGSGREVTIEQRRGIKLVE